MAVLAVGADHLGDNLAQIAHDLKVGDLVLYAKYGGTEIKLEGENVLILKESDVLAVIES